MSAQIAFGFIWKVSIHSCSLEMTSDGEILLHGYASKCDVAPSNTIRKTKGFDLQLFAEPLSKKMRSPTSSAFTPLTRDLSGLGFVELQDGHVLHHMLVKVIRLSWNIQMSCSLLKLCRRHVVVLQVKVFQVAHIRQLVDNVLECLTVWIFAQTRNVFWSLTRSSWHILFQCGRWISPDWRSFSSS